MPKNKKIIELCRVCDSKEISFLCDTKNNHGNLKLLHHFKCNNCGSVFVANTVSGDELGIAYASLDTKTYYQEIDSENEKKFMTAIHHLKTISTNKAKILDVGAGEGAFINFLHQNGFNNLSAHEIEGADLSKLSNGIAKSIYQDYDYGTIPSNEFEIVTLLDVAEHVINPQYLFDTCSRILKKDGLVYFHTPVVTKTDRVFHFLLKVPMIKRIAVYWQMGRTSIFHLENYTKKSIELILKNAGFHNIEIKVQNELSWPLDRYIKIYFLERFGLPKFFGKILKPVFNILLATNFFNANKAIVKARKK